MSHRGVINFETGNKPVQKTNQTFDPIRFLSSSKGEHKLGTHSTAFVYTDGTWKAYVRYGCMACLGYVYGGIKMDTSYYGGINSKQAFPDCETIYTTLWSHDGDDRQHYIDIWNFILSPDGPWGAIAKHVEKIYDGTTLIGYKINNAGNLPSQLLANMMFTGRMPYAQDGFMRAWIKYREHFSDTESMYLAASVAVSDKGEPRFPYIGDYSFDTQWFNMDWSRFSNANPLLRAGYTLNKGTGFHPVNSIWNMPTPKCTKEIEFSPFDVYQKWYVSVRSGSQVQKLIKTGKTKKSRFGGEIIEVHDLKTAIQIWKEDQSWKVAA